MQYSKHTIKYDMIDVDFDGSYMLYYNGQLVDKEYPEEINSKDSQIQYEKVDHRFDNYNEAGDFELFPVQLKQK